MTDFGIAGRIWTLWETNLMKRPFGRGRLASGRVWDNKRITRASWLMNASCAISIHTTGGLISDARYHPEIRSPQSDFAYLRHYSSPNEMKRDGFRTSDWGLREGYGPLGKPIL